MLGPAVIAGGFLCRRGPSVLPAARSLVVYALKVAQLAA